MYGMLPFMYCIMFWGFVLNIITYHLGRYEPSSSTTELNGLIGKGFKVIGSNPVFALQDSIFLNWSKI